MVYLHNRGRKGTAMKFREARAGTKTDTDHPQAGQLCGCGKNTMHQLDTRELCYIAIRCGYCGYTSSIDRSYAAAWADARAAAADARAAAADARAACDARAAWADARAACRRGQG